MEPRISLSYGVSEDGDAVVLVDFESPIGRAQGPFSVSPHRSEYVDREALAHMRPLIEFTCEKLAIPVPADLDTDLLNTLHLAQAAASA